MPTPWSDLALVAAVAACLSAVLGVFRVNPAAIDAPILLQVLRRLCDEGNLSRLLKLCSAAGPAVPCAAGIKAACLRCARPAPQPEHRGYRDASAASPAGALDELRLAYEQAAAPLLRSLSLTPLLWALALLVAGCAAWLHPLAQPHPRAGWWFQVALGAAAVATLWGGRLLWSIHAGTALVQGILGPMAEAWQSGKFLEQPAPKPAPPPVRSAPTPAPAGLVFEVHEPGQPARRVAVPRATVLKLGRQERNHLRLSHPSVALIHAVLEEEGDHWQVIDLGTEEGTVLNGEPVQKAAVREGDTMLLGEVVVRLLPAGSAAEEAPPG